MDPTAPTVSVVLAVHDGEAHLVEAIDSVLAQTFPDFELLLLDDGSRDRSREIMRGYDDPRVRLVARDEHEGLIATLNAGLEVARGRYIARLDADDVALPERFERQVEFLEGHPDVGICGTWYRTFGFRGERVVRWPTGHEDLVEALLHEGNPLGHPTVMIRREALGELRYETEYRHAEDYRLWTRLCHRTHLANLPEVLLLYREHEGQVSTRHEGEMQRVSLQIRAELALHPGGSLPRPGKDAIRSLFLGEGSFGAEAAREAASAVDHLVEANERTSEFAPERYAELLGRLWTEGCWRRSPSRLEALINRAFRAPRHLLPGRAGWLRRIRRALGARG